jgi:hypothetical protein
MKKFFFSALLFTALGACAQESTEIKPAAKGVVYGTAITPQGTTLTPSEIQANMAGGFFEGKVTGKVTEVCKTMGCWIKIEKGDGTSMMVKSKDHGFFMPQNLVGKTVVIEGTAEEKVVTEAKRKHFAEDAGKSKEEIKNIKGDEKQVQFIAKGIMVVD